MTATAASRHDDTVLRMGPLAKLKACRIVTRLRQPSGGSHCISAVLRKGSTLSVGTSKVGSINGRMIGCRSAPASVG